MHESAYLKLQYITYNGLHFTLLDYLITLQLQRWNQDLSHKNSKTLQNGGNKT